MNEHPILFSGEMVKAILAKRKTQTRRIAKHQPEFGAYVSLEGWDRIVLVHENAFGEGVSVQACPLARKIGDRLWVREKCAIGFNDDDDLVVDYHADGKRRWFDVTPENERYSLRYINDDRNRAARFMPRWASRITLEVVDVRAERLKEISEDDAQSEGATASGGWNADDSEYSVGYRAAFSRAWDAINGKGAWALNPWVWVYEFRYTDM